MSGPPDWSDIPPYEADPRAGSSPGRGGGASHSGGGRRGGPPQMTAAEIAEASADFFEWLASPATLSQLKMLLPEHVDVGVFVATAKTAVLTKPQLLRADFRASLLTGLMKAAGQGLLPDGKQGALVPRYDTETRAYAVAWQPMVWGVIKLGRETGAIRAIRASLVFHGEKFRIIGGEEDIIEHEVDVDIVDEAYAALNAGRDGDGNALSRPADFIARVRAAYCFIYGTDGTVTKRWMTRQRLISLWESTRADKGPWSGRWIDEMFLKGMILFTAKWINLDPNSIAAKRFQAAMLTDLELDFERDQDAPPAPEAEQATLAPPADKLSGLEATHGAALVRQPSARHPGTRQPKPAASARTAPTQDKQAGPQADGRPFIARATEALAVDGGIGFRWMRTLQAVLTEVPSMNDLATLHGHPIVARNVKEAPPKHRMEIEALFRAAADRLGNLGEEAA